MQQASSRSPSRPSRISAAIIRHPDDAGDRRPTLEIEIVREARIEVDGAYDPELACPLLSLDDQFAEKILANSDRGKDPAASYRDIFDLGILLVANGGRIPMAASEKAVTAYGPTIWRDLKWVVGHLRARPSALTRAAEDLRMDPALARTAVRAVSRAYKGRLPPDREDLEKPVVDLTPRSRTSPGCAAGRRLSP